MAIFPQAFSTVSAATTQVSMVACTEHSKTKPTLKYVRKYKRHCITALNERIRDIT